MSNKTRNETLRRLAENDPHLTSVNVTPDDFSRVTAALQGNTHIDTLFVDIKAAVDRRNELPLPAYLQWKEFCRAAQALPSLKTVWVIMRSEEPSEEYWILVGILLDHTKQIKTLFLRGLNDCNGSNFNSPAVRQLDGSLTELAGLEDFYFDNFQIQPTDVAPLLSALSSLPTLNTVYLYLHCQREPLLDDAFFFLERLLQKQSLVCFRYAKVAFSDAQADAIADIMSRNFDMEHLRFYQTEETEATENLQQNIDAITKLNKAGRRYLAERGPECKAAGINVLSAVSDDLDYLFYHLRENPALMSDLVGKSP